MKRVAVMLALAVVTATPAIPHADGPVVPIRLATLVPTGSLWDKGLRQMASEWSQATQARVTVTIFPGGAMGDEATIVRKLRFDNPQAAALSGIGLARIDDAFNVFSTPFFLQSYDELDYVADALTPALRARLDRKGLVLLAWGHVGWAHLFSTIPVRTLEDLRRIRLFTAAGDDRMLRFYKANGFQARALPATDILIALTSGMIDGLPAPPAAALAFQWFRHTKFMVNTGLAPVIGAIVMTRKSWERIPETDRVSLLASAKAMERRLAEQVPRAERESIAEMQKRGLTVTAAEGGEWQSTGQSLASTLTGQMVPADILELALKARNEFRQRGNR
jgi:TRAP-type transport system periplasmic protein